MSWTFRRRSPPADESKSLGNHEAFDFPDSDRSKAKSRPAGLWLAATRTGPRSAAVALVAALACAYYLSVGVGPPAGPVQAQKTPGRRADGSAADARPSGAAHRRKVQKLPAADGAADDASATTPTCPVGSRLPAADGAFLHSMFTRLSTDPKHAHLSPVVKSVGGTTSVDPPWILVLDDFLSAEEVEVVMSHLRSDAAQKQFQILSLAGGSHNSNYNYRRSESMNCDGPCLEEPWIRPLVSRMTDATGLDRKHAEGLKLTHYGKGGFFGPHHDYILEETETDKWRNCGNRILTFLVYLNDVESGGTTRFFHLGIDVEPKPGRALLFTDVFHDRPREKDERTAHEAKVVEGGEKFIAQTWFFLYDYQANKAHNCC